MKKIFKITFSLLLIAQSLLFFSACNEAEDLMTETAVVGGLVNPTSIIPYKLASTPTLDVDIVVPHSEAIQTIRVEYKYIRLTDTTESNMQTFDIDVSGANAAGEITKTMTFTWSQLIAGVVLPNDPQLPATDTDPIVPSFIGDYWEFTYTTIMEDGREVINGQTTKISIANFFAGAYSRECLYFHPTAGGSYPDEAYGGVRVENIDLVPISVFECTAPFGVWTDDNIVIHIANDNTVTCTFPTRADAVNGDPYDATKVDTYDPATGILTIYYHYYGTGGPRIFYQTFTPK